MCKSTDSLRVIPSDWLGPLNLNAVFGHKPASLEVDLGCGKGRFLQARAERHPDVSFLGIDRLLLRILRVEREARRRNLANIRLLYGDVCYTLSYLLPARSVTTCYIFFPDPWPKRKHHRRRLFDEEFLSALNTILVSTGSIHIATDHLDYFDTIRKIFSCDPRFETIPPLELTDGERTDFELQFMNEHRTIGRCSFRKIT